MDKFAKENNIFRLDDENQMESKVEIIFPCLLCSKTFKNRNQYECHESKLRHKNRE